jgi:hypothetical protein
LKKIIRKAARSAVKKGVIRPLMAASSNTLGVKTVVGMLSELENNLDGFYDSIGLSPRIGKMFVSVLGTSLGSGLGYLGSQMLGSEVSSSLAARTKEEQEQQDSINRSLQYAQEHYDEFYRQRKMGEITEPAFQKEVDELFEYVVELLEQSNV